MAKIDLKFLDLNDYGDCISVVNRNTGSFSYIEIIGEEDGKLFNIHLDVSTAIKFAKTLRTEINKAKEVTNG